MRPPPRSEMRDDSPTLHAEQFRDPHQIWNSRDSPRTPSEFERNTKFSTATRGMVRVHQIVSRSELIPCFRLKTYGNFMQSSQEEASLSNRELQRFPENTVRIREEHQVQHGNSRNGPCTPNRLQIRADSLL
ncbi:unnamed protein product [Rangifer tarandus platyrhynchus]|uniref:Uncharacterized protein n=1 Tax=Rangifer tarandus platyrhynchus TaxID=3082113 RepID=A0ABN8ZFI9_RANTA|nr:unnamed protein product [Rangifer tarandus platyrhynchus]